MLLSITFLVHSCIYVIWQHKLDTGCQKQKEGAIWTFIVSSLKHKTDFIHNQHSLLYVGMFLFLYNFPHSHCHYHIVFMAHISQHHQQRQVVYFLVYFLAWRTRNLGQFTLLLGYFLQAGIVQLCTKMVNLRYISIFGSQVVVCWKIFLLPCWWASWQSCCDGK